MRFSSYLIQLAMLAADADQETRGEKFAPAVNTAGTAPWSTSVHLYARRRGANYPVTFLC